MTGPIDRNFTPGSEITSWRRVLKWPLRAPVTDVPLGPDDSVVHVGTQDGVPTLWVEHHGRDPEKGATRRVRGFGTGEPIPPQFQYIGTATGVEGWMAFHIYIEGEHPGGWARAMNTVNARQRPAAPVVLALPPEPPVGTVVRGRNHYYRRLFETELCRWARGASPDDMASIPAWSWGEVLNDGPVTVQ